MDFQTIAHYQEQEIEELKAAAKEYLAAVRALHTTHGSSDVHGKGGIAAAAVTPHCGMICNTSGEHLEEKRRYMMADAALAVILNRE